jgi:hypothetical protein
MNVYRGIINSLLMEYFSKKSHSATVPKRINLIVKININKINSGRFFEVALVLIRITKRISAKTGNN